MCDLQYSLLNLHSFTATHTDTIFYSLCFLPSDRIQLFLINFSVPFFRCFSFLSLFITAEINVFRHIFFPSQFLLRSQYLILWLFLKAIFPFPKLPLCVFFFFFPFRQTRFEHFITRHFLHSSNKVPTLAITHLCFTSSFITSLQSFLLDR